MRRECVIERVAIDVLRMRRYDIVSHPAEVRRHIGSVPQLLSANGSLTGYENMLLSARLYGVSRQERAERITRALARIGLAEAAHLLAGQYSGGMIRRLEIAQSLLRRPTVLFLDEPTVGPEPSPMTVAWQVCEKSTLTLAARREPIPCSRRAIRCKPLPNSLFRFTGNSAANL